ncbi:MAG: FtsP/CotA-like multicopper oxidase with cupredoxin domain [Fibrobacteres bacterium]|nr:FtsP/CotA-like multicopper oxidase with cupredoxin domain [Fibrobacterota bacterium]
MNMTDGLGRASASIAAPWLIGLVGLLGLSGCGPGGGKTSPEVAAPDYFPRGVEGLESVRPMQTLELKDGDTLRLTAAPVKKILHGRETRMLAYNGSIPGPLIKVPEGATITVLLKNRTGSPTSLHSHGVRMDSRFDGNSAGTVAATDSEAVPYTIKFPDPGLFWYHSHVREDYSQEMGLYGNYYVVPKDPSFWKPVDREEFLVIDDVLTDSLGIAPFRKDLTDYAMMGRFGNLFLVNGDTGYSLTVKRNELIRFYVTNVSNARVLRLGFALNSNIKLVGSDNGPFENPILSGAEYLAPGERSVFECYFPTPGVDSLIQDTPNKDYRLARVQVLDDSAASGLHRLFYSYDSNAYAMKTIDPFRRDFGKTPDKELLLTARMGGHSHAAAKTGAAQHLTDGIEWEDHMGGMNEASTSETMTWIIRDRATGLENHEIRWAFKQGDRVLIRIYNDSTSMHPMPHPIHFHGQRFLVVRINGQENFSEMGWKDTYLVGKGETTDILLDASNPGDWLAHCHISEHMESDMMFHYTVGPAVP